MALPRSRSTTPAPSPQFLLVEGLLLVGLLWLTAPIQMSQWGKWLYQQITDYIQPSLDSAAPFQQTNRIRFNHFLTAQSLQSRALAIQPPQVARAIAAQPAASTPSSSHWTAETIEYFVDVALSSEYGDSGTIRKWQNGLRIQVFGTPTATDLQTLSTVTQELSHLTGLAIALVNESPNVELHFAPIAKFAQLEPNYKTGNEGFFWTWYENGVIDRARILINSQQTDTVRSHLLREEFTQSLGLMNDSRRHPDSIFYQGWTETQTFSPADQAIIQMLYQAKLQPNMTQAEVMQALQRS